MNPFAAIPLILCLPVLAMGPGEKRIEVPGSTTVVRLMDKTPPSYRVSLDRGKTWTEELKADSRILMRYGRFDPISSLPFVASFLQAPKKARLFLVQFHTQLLDAYRRDLQRHGVEVGLPMPEQAVLVRMNPTTAATVQKLPYVRWVGAYHLAYRLDEGIRAALLRGETLGKKRYDIGLFRVKTDRVPLAAAIRALGGEVNNASEGHVLVEATLNRSQLLEVLGRDEVLFVDPWSEPEEDMDNARIYGGANYVETKGPLGGHTGKGVKGHIMEGIYRTHPEFAANSWRSAPIGLKNTSPSGHGNATFGVVFARGKKAAARGMLPDGQGYFTNYRYVYGNSNRNALVSLLKKTYHVMFQTASWGYARTTSYTNRSAEMDTIIFGNDIPITQSQSNAGATPSRPQAWAKNIFSIGGIRHRNTLTPNDDYWGRAGSIGPAADGRIKPTLCAYYDSIYTTGYSSSSYTQFGGTSGATPINAGHVGLLIELWTDGDFGYPGKRGDWKNRHLYLPHYTTVKAMMVNQALQYPFSGTRHDLTRVHQGWGWPSVRGPYDERDRMLIINENHLLKNLQTRSYLVFVPRGKKEFKASLNWSEPAANPAASKTRLNDLDLRVTDPKGTVYWGNNGLLASNYSSPGGSRNDVDTLENVFVKTPRPGIWRVDVRAAKVSIDNHRETPATDVDYALVVSGLGGMRDKTGLKLAMTTRGNGDLTIGLSNLSAGYTEGWTILSFNTSGVLGHGSVCGIEFDALSAATIAWPVSLGNPIHFKATANPNLFPNKPYSFSAGTFSILKGFSLDGVSVLVDGAGILACSNVARVKF
jgi:hypothetical protein